MIPLSCSWATTYEATSAASWSSLALSATISSCSCVMTLSQEWFPSGTSSKSCFRKCSGNSWSMVYMCPFSWDQVNHSPHVKNLSSGFTSARSNASGTLSFFMSIRKPPTWMSRMSPKNRLPWLMMLAARTSAFAFNSPTW